MSKQEFCVVFKLTKNEQAAFEKFSRDNEIADNIAIPLLIKNYLIENDAAHKEEINHSLYEQRLRDLEINAGNWKQEFNKCQVKNEKLEENLAYLEQELIQVIKQLKTLSHKQLNDDEIAAITGRRVQEVWEWRHGIRKPRGKRTLEKLAPYEIKDGVWIKK